jgi:hypothetical protein
LAKLAGSGAGINIRSGRPAATQTDPALRSTIDILPPGW